MTCVHCPHTILTVILRRLARARDGPRRSPLLLLMSLLLLMLLFLRLLFLLLLLLWLLLLWLLLLLLWLLL